LPTSSQVDVWSEIASAAAGESPLWSDALRPDDERELVPVFSTLARARFALGVETIYEGYLAHYGQPRLFAPADRDVALLLGDYLYAEGLVRIAAAGDVDAVADLAALISLCAQLQADGADGDGAAWAATAALLGDEGGYEELRAELRARRSAEELLAIAHRLAAPDAVASVLAAHASRLR
jgi:hypothetical protein